MPSKVRNPGLHALDLCGMGCTLLHLFLDWRTSVRKRKRRWPKEMNSLVFKRLENTSEQRVGSLSISIIRAIVKFKSPCDSDQRFSWSWIRIDTLDNLVSFMTNLKLFADWYQARIIDMVYSAIYSFFIDTKVAISAFFAVSLKRKQTSHGNLFLNSFIVSKEVACLLIGCAKQNVSKLFVALGDCFQPKSELFNFALTWSVIVPQLATVTYLKLALECCCSHSAPY